MRIVLECGAGTADIFGDFGGDCDAVGTGQEHPIARTTGQNGPPRLSDSLSGPSTGTPLEEKEDAVATQPMDTLDTACNHLREALRSACLAGQIPIALVTCPEGIPDPEPLNVRLDSIALACALRDPEAPVRPAAEVERTWVAHYRVQLLRGEIGLGLVGVETGGAVTLAPWGDRLAAARVTEDRFRAVVYQTIEDLVPHSAAPGRRHVTYVGGTDLGGGMDDFPEGRAC